MRVVVNGEPRDLPPGTTLAAIAPERVRGVAVALDGAVVPHGAWAETQLTDGQRVEILEAKAGG
jgi:sulfur carrier protein